MFSQPVNECKYQPIKHLIKVFSHEFVCVYWVVKEYVFLNVDQKFESH